MGRGDKGGRAGKRKDGRTDGRAGGLLLKPGTSKMPSNSDASSFFCRVRNVRARAGGCHRGTVGNGQASTPRQPALLYPRSRSAFCNHNRNKSRSTENLAELRSRPCEQNTRIGVAPNALICFMFTTTCKNNVSELDGMALPYYYVLDSLRSRTS